MEQKHAPPVRAPKKLGLPVPFAVELQVDNGHAKAPRKKRDAILGHVASWGDREPPYPT
jgi:hypothetical protein